MKTRRKLLIVSALLWVAIAGSAYAQQFPRLQEENLNGQQVVLPDAAAGNEAVLVLGFSKASSKPTGEWTKRIQSDFGNASSFQLWQLAVLEDVPRMLRGMVISGIKKGIPENQRGRFLAVRHNEDELKKLVGFKAEDDAYIVILDRSGKVSYLTHGVSVDPGYAELKARLQAMLK